MPGYLFCALCGLPFSADCMEIKDPEDFPIYAPYAYDGSLLSPSQVKWLEDFRVITSEDDEIPFDAEMKLDKSIPVSTRAWSDGSETVYFGQSMQEYGVYITQEDQIFRVAAHETCLEIAHTIVRWREAFSVITTQDFRPRSLKQIYQAIRENKNRPEMKYQGNIRWPNEFYGAMLCWGQPWSSVSGKEWLVSDPLEDFGIEDFIISKLKRPLEQTVKGLDPQVKQPVRLLADLESLPAPAISRLLEFLDIKSVLTLRRCSSGMCSAVTLTNRFWKDRLLSGEAVPWLWGVDLSTLEQFGMDNDWRGFVRSLVDKSVLQDETLALGIRNRIRIWRTVSEIR